MASTVTVTNLTDRLRRATDIENATTRFPDAELQDYLKTAHRKWTDFLLNNNGAHLLETTQSVNTVADTATVSLVSNFYRMVGVDAVVNGCTRTLLPLPAGERNRFKADGITWQGTQRLFYRVVATDLTLYPTPDAVYALTIHYIPESEVDFTIGGNTIDGYNGWDEYIVLEAALMVMDKDNRNNDHLLRRKLDLETTVISSIRSLDDGEPQRVTDAMWDEHNPYLSPWC